MNEVNSITLSVVMPAYNEGAHITKNLLLTSKILSGFVKKYEIIAVNDGSTDDTEKGIIAAANEDAHINYISYMPNGGKGHAIREGIGAAVGKYIAFLDSDLEMSPELLKDFMHRMKKYNADIVIGSKMHPQTQIEYPLKRKIMSLGYFILLKAMFRLNLHDTQCGIKLFKRDIIKPIAESLKTEGYAFDIEILAKASRKGYNIVEAPIVVKYSRNAENESRRIGIRDVFKVFSETVKIKKYIREYK